MLLAACGLLLAAPALPVSFENDVEPILTRAGCNSGPCHGKARGQNGFQLSLLGFDPDFDHRALARDVFGRRTDPVRPEERLILLKATATLPHGGGRRFDRSSPHYATLRGWIAQGLARDAGPKRSLERIDAEPPSLTLAFGERRPLRITARYSDGTTREVTPLATYLSSEAPVAAVDDRGEVAAGPLPGDAAILAGSRGGSPPCRSRSRSRIGRRMRTTRPFPVRTSSTSWSTRS